jgi:hypothetical protein
MLMYKQQKSAVIALFVVLSSIVSAAALPASASAIEPATVSGSVLTTSPVSAVISAEAGHSVSTNLQVQNNGTTPETINVKLEKFKPQGDGGQATIYKPTSSDQSTKWVSFSRTSLIAQPGVWNTVKVTFNLPNDATQGYYYAILFEPQAGVVSTTKDETSIVKGANAIFVLVNTNSKNETRRLVVTNFASEHNIYEFLPANFNISVQNSGNIFLAPQGDVFITRTLGGKTLATLPMNQAAGNVLPDSTRVFQASWTDGFPEYQAKKVNGEVVDNSKGQPIQQLVWSSSSSFSKIRIGKYYAHLAFVYNNGTNDVTSNAVVAFWVIPWKFILYLIVIIAILITGWRLLKKYTKQALKGNKTNTTKSGRKSDSSTHSKQRSKE